MGVVFFVILWPIIFAAGIYVIILPFIPYIILVSSIFWLGTGLLIRYVFNRHQLFEKGLGHEKTWVRVITNIFFWIVRIDIVVNIILIIGSVILAFIFFAKGITPFLF